MAYVAPGWPVLLAGTVLLRPYVFVFLAVFLVLAGRDLGWRRAFGWLGWGWAVAYVGEYASTRIGIPFGLYHYTGETAWRELFVSNVPFFDPLSFPFLAYASYCLARWALGQARGWAPATLTGALMMLLDVVVDPLAVRGEAWFLGRIFYYAEPGTYFGVPLSNFAGWFLVGWAIVGGYLWAVGRRPQALGSPLGGIGLYYGVVLFNLGITGWIGEGTLLGAGILVHVAVFLLVYALKAISVTRGWTVERPAEERAAVITTTIDERGH
jgi:putative membrane protein